MVTRSKENERQADRDGAARDTLLAISRALASAQGRDELLQAVTDAALAIVPGADKCVIHLLDADGELLIPAVCSSPAPVQVGRGMPADEGIAGRALVECRLVNVADVRGDPGFVPLRSGPEIRSLLVVPLRVHSRRLGTLSLSSALVGAFGALDEEHLAVLAAQASVAIHQAELVRAATDQKERSDAVIASVSEGIVVLDARRHVRVVNPSLACMLGIDHLIDKLPCPLCEIPALAEILPSRGSVIGPYDAEVVKPSGDELTLRITTQALFSHTSAQVIVIRDVTEERKAAEAQALFISQVAHELRTPLQHVLSFVSLVNDLEDLSREEERRYLAQIEHETRRLGRLVNDLVLLSSIETGQFSTWLETIDACALIPDSVTRLQAHAATLDIQLTLSCPSQSVALVSDPARLEQVIVNLIDNALKHVPPGGHVGVALRAEDDDTLTLAVTDDGPGIPQADLPHLFDSFYQAPASKSRRSGMGLGLHICKQIVEQLGGSIGVDSELGVGSTFTVALPIRRVKDP